MDTKSKNFSHSLALKTIAFIIAVICFTGAIIQIADVVIYREGNFNSVYEEDYFLSREYAEQADDVLSDVASLINVYKSEEHIRAGGTISEEDLKNEEDNLFWDFQNNSKSYDADLSEEANYEKFKEEYAARIIQAREMLIKDDLKEYNLMLQKVEQYEGIFYYASDGTQVYTNSVSTDKQRFKNHPSYLIFEDYEQEVFPQQIRTSDDYSWIVSEMNTLDPETDALYIAFTDDFLKPQIEQWEANKAIATQSAYRLAGFLALLMLSFIYLAIVIGRDSFKDKEVHLNSMDTIYNDINLGLCLALIGLWIGTAANTDQRVILFVTAPIAAAGLLLILSLIKHIKNRTFFRHTLIYRIFSDIFRFIGEVYKSGSVGVKLVLLVIGYPLLVAATFFMFPITIGIAAWLTLKKIKAFNEIKVGVERIKSGDIYHTIEVEGKGELSMLAHDINSIADGLKNAVDSELKSERLKTELITNVSHDIRTPLTSIITYVDLLKQETDPSKSREYIEVLDQKSQRLKTLTDDLFEAAKAASGSVAVNFESIDIVSLITQGLGELNDEIEESELEFRTSYPNEKLYVSADGKLLWRAVENLLSNIFKYALRGSRVYIDIEDMGSEVLISIKNISAYELNISADELMERFKRGDESRSSQGSGLGLSIAKSLIDMQKGRFSVQVDGDLFKAMIYMPKNR